MSGFAGNTSFSFVPSGAFGKFFASQGFAEFAIFGYSCDFSGKCAAFETNAGQFALDNVNMQISAVPEPGSWMMLLGGFGTIAAFRRRRTA